MLSGPFLFGPVSVDARQVFYAPPRRLSVAFVNLKPFLPGHVLVASFRPCKRMADLSDDEVSDMWATARRVSAVLERVHGCTSFTYAVQDGPDAGQTVPHVHIHVIPRSKGDLERNDDIYEMVEKHGPEDVARVDPDARGAVARSMDDMAAEAERYAALLAEAEAEAAPEPAQEGASLAKGSDPPSPARL